MHSETVRRLATFLIAFLIAAVQSTAAESKPQTPSAKADQPTPAVKDKSKPQHESGEPNDKKTETPAAPTLELKNKSSFEMEGDNRSPFWPIGWKPSAVPTTNANEHAGDIPPGAFVVSSITMDPIARFAIINGKTMAEGQQFGLQVGSQTYQLTVKTIEDGRVILSRRNQEIVVPLRRK